jgi:hypothetical protein
MATISFIAEASYRQDYTSQTVEMQEMTVGERVAWRASPMQLAAPAAVWKSGSSREGTGEAPVPRKRSHRMS